MNRLAKLSPLVIVLGLCLGFAAAFPSFLMSYVLKPLGISLWLAWRLVISVDQDVYWTLLLLMCAGWAIGLLAYSRGDVPSAPASSGPHPLPTRLAGWQALLHDAARANDGEQDLRARLMKLFAAVEGLPEDLDRPELENALATRHISMPPEVYRYLFPAQGGAGKLHARPGGHSFPWAAALFNRLARRPAIPNQTAIDKTLRWLEHIMEISHDQ